MTIYIVQVFSNHPDQWGNPPDVYLFDNELDALKYANDRLGAVYNCRVGISVQEVGDIAGNNTRYYYRMGMKDDRPEIWEKIEEAKKS